MEITWYGHSCFRLTERGMASVVADPYDYRTVGYDALKLKADIVTVSHEAPGHNFVSAVKGQYHLINGPGEYEIGGVFITGVQTNGTKKRDPNEKRNTLYVFDYDGLTIAHLGDLNHVPSQTEIEALGNVHIALVPVGGGGGLNAAKAVEMISLLEPGIVIPMHFGTASGNIKLASVSKFLKEMGLGTIEPQPSLKVTKSSVPEETKVVVLAYEKS
jgi:L-ascorbate metabolism protein UlaG (beta-lactamase superfamily)